MALEAGSSTEPSSGSRKLLMICSMSSRLQETRSFADFCTFFFIVSPWHSSQFAMLCSTASFCHIWLPTELLCSPCLGRHAVLSSGCMCGLFENISWAHDPTCLVLGNLSFHKDIKFFSLSPQAKDFLLSSQVLHISYGFFSLISWNWLEWLSEDCHMDRWTATWSVAHKVT